MSNRAFSILLVSAVLSVGRGGRCGLLRLLSGGRGRLVSAVGPAVVVVAPAALGLALAVVVAFAAVGAGSGSLAAVVVGVVVVLVAVVRGRRGGGRIVSLVVVFAGRSRGSGKFSLLFNGSN